MKERKWAFDLEVEGTESEPREINWLVNLADTAVTCQDWESAYLLLDRASASDKGSLKLAELFLNPEAELEIPVVERQEKAKQILRCLANEEGVCTADACVMLASLDSSRPLAAVSYRLKAERLNGHTNNLKIQQLVPRIRSLGSDDPYGAYKVAIELEYYEGHDVLALKKELYQIAAEAESCFAGIAALRLSEFYDGDPYTVLKYKKIAEKNGFPAILTRN